MSKEQVVTKQFVVFRLDNQLFGVNIKRVQIIEKLKTIMRVPKAPKCVQGVMNLRGDIIPVINIRKLLEMDEFVASEESRIVIIKIEESLVGIMVDGVKEVLELTTEQIEGIQNVQPLTNQYISGIGKVEEEGIIITLLNLRHVIEEAFGMVKNG